MLQPPQLFLKQERKQLQMGISIRQNKYPLTFKTGIAEDKFGGGRETTLVRKLAQKE